MKPYEPGLYRARDIVLDMLNQPMYSLPYVVRVVSGVPNVRGHALLVETGGEKPRYRGLDCYDWIERVPADPWPGEIEYRSWLADAEIESWRSAA